MNDSPSKIVFLADDKLYWNDDVFDASDIDKTSFQLIGNGSYGVDGKHAYYIGEKNGEIDIASFQYVAEEYYKDKNHVYRYNIKIEGGDSENFECVTGRFSKDKNHVYYNTDIFPDADPVTFSYVEDKTGVKGDYCKDKNHK